MNIKFTLPVIPDHPSPEGERYRIDSGPSPAGSHEVGTFLTCERLWAMFKFTDLRSIYDPYIRGGLLHVALAHDYARYALMTQKKPLLCGDRLIQHADELYTPLEAMRLAALALPPREREHAACLFPECVKTIQNYEKHAITTRPRTRVLSIETLVETILPGGNRHTARVDFEEEEVAGSGVWVGDHKSTSQPTAKAKALYAASLQLSALTCFGRQKHGSRFRGVVLHLIRLGSGVSERIIYNAPYLTQDTPRLLTATRARMAATQAQNGSNVYAYLPTGLGGGCKDGSKACPGLSLCAFRTNE